MKEWDAERQAAPGTSNHSTVVLALRAADSEARGLLAHLTKSAPPPLDLPGLLAVVAGANTAARAAFQCLKAPNAAAVALLDELHCLGTACAEAYAARPGCVDAAGVMGGRLKANPAWALLCKLGDTEGAADHPATVAAGIELLLSLHANKPMAIASCSSARVALKEGQLNSIPIEEIFDLYEGEPWPQWLKRCRATYPEFLAAFDSTPPPPPSPRTFEERARTELRCRAAFASHRRRAGVLDDTCFSRRQVSAAVAYSGFGVFRTPEERRAALWIVGCSGLFTTSTPFIPIAGSTVEDWAIIYDLEAGVLRRDLSCLAPDAAKARPDCGAPASFVATTPAPRDVANELRRSAKDSPGAREMGDLIPALRHLRPRDLVYPEISDLGPSFARWSRTLAPFALQVGLDAMLAGLTTGDIGVTAKSKLHYALVTGDEQWQSAAALYKEIGWDSPVQMPAATLSFGAAVVPTAEQLSRLDDRFFRWVEEMRPAKRLDGEAKLLEFHNRFVRTLTSRICVWLSLRPANEISIRASVDERFDLCIELNEKASAGRVGTRPAVVCDGLRAALVNYRVHCSALLDRLMKIGCSGAATEWLNSVLANDDVPLLCTIQSASRVSPVSTDSLLKGLPGASELANDWGRKFSENALRRLGAQSRDIDRHQRHEVLGQEQDCATSDDSELSWTRRLKPKLDEMSGQLFKAPLHGLRKGDQAK